MRGARPPSSKRSTAVRAYRTVRQSDLPEPEELSWRLAATCRIVSPALFFHPTNERGPKRQKRIHEAKKICSQCPVQRPCRDYALAVREPFGIWGGMSEEDRDRILGRGRGRADNTTERSA
ncbi:possible transcriptional regulator, WhiB family protein [Rhodococcus jostii RHA1]|uniref:Transcriptional regulator WhiB n=1 Tax=Rhodococcus jostii (strain RHA1) TaxID=101510 RepID=Q0SJC4_RHOJR|nr:possible transcriptional regulator, WhiB family protein [Rhodococcus jostii RHA1]